MSTSYVPDHLSSTYSMWMRKSVENLGKTYADLDFLLQSFYEVLCENGRSDLANALPWLKEIPSLPGDSIDENTVQLYSIAFQLLNMAEENGAVQARRKRENQGMAELKGLWAESLQDLVDNNLNAEQISALLSEVRVEPVFTAHPTEAKRSTVLEHHRDLYELMVKRENTTYTRVEQEEIKREIKNVLDRIWRTGEIYLEKPDVHSELRNVLHYFQNVLPHAVHLLFRRFEAAWREVGLDPAWLEKNNIYPRIAFGNWVGGDRDGHPFVTHEITRETLHILRLQAISLIREQLIILVRHLSFYVEFNDTPDTFKARFTQMRVELGELGQRAYNRNEKEIFRQFINLMVYKLPLEVVHDHVIELKQVSHSYVSSKELLDDLFLLQDTLIHWGAKNVAHTDVQNVINQVQTFGFHLANLDVRQNSSFHDKAINQILEVAGLTENTSFADWNEEKRLAFLSAELNSARPFTHPNIILNDEALAVISCHKVLQEHVSMFGLEGLGSLIVSMTRSVSDLFSVFILAREAGLWVHQHDGHACNLHVVPLFETIDDLKAAPAIMDAYLANPFVKRSLLLKQKERGEVVPIQQIMVGYSDSNKDGGILASQWNLYEAQTRLAEVGRTHGVRIRFFHGKGGSISRGAGPTHYFIQNLPELSIQGEMRLTEQGETISQKYANRINASHNLELLMANTTRVSVLDAHNLRQREDSLDILKRMADISYKHYRALLEDPHFIAFFGQATPIDVIEQSKIGSRPARRKGERTLNDLRAIPWVFSWAQSRYNITSWYGVGATLKEIKENHPEEFETLKKEAFQDTLIRYVLINVDSSLASTDENMMRAYAELVTDTEAREAILGKIMKEFHLVKTILYGDIFTRPFEQRRMHHYYSTQLRAEALASLHKHQIGLLKQWRAAKADNLPEKEQQHLLTQLLLTVNAISGALRVTG